MKKILCGALCMMIGISAMAEWPGWKCKDVKKLEAAKQAYLTENKTESAMTMDVIKVFAQKEPVSFADVEAAVDAVQKPADFPEARFIGWKNYTKKVIALWAYPSFCSDGWEFCKKNPSGFDVYFILDRSEKIGISKNEQYSRLISCIFDYNYEIDRINQMISKVIELADSQDPVQVKKDLQRMNRRFSKNLLKDKEKWEPIIALIRTTLETY